MSIFCSVGLAIIPVEDGKDVGKTEEPLAV